MENKEIKIGDKLKKARQSCGLTQEEVSEKIGCAPRYVGQLETNRATGSIPMILEFCTLYNITLNDLYCDYLPADCDSKDLTNFSGYFKLNDEHRSIIDNTIAFLNKLENK